jgi:hypothetical protein
MRLIVQNVTSFIKHLLEGSCTKDEEVLLQFNRFFLHFLLMFLFSLLFNRLQLNHPLLVIVHLPLDEGQVIRPDIVSVLKGFVAPILHEVYASAVLYAGFCRLVHATIAVCKV